MMGVACALCFIIFYVTKYKVYSHHREFRSFCLEVGIYRWGTA
jgi:hypothetical protein